LYPLGRTRVPGTNRKSSTRSQSVGFRRIQRQENEADVLFILCDDDKYDDAEFAADVSRRCVVSCCLVVALMMQKENADYASNASKVDCSITQNDLILTSR
jgi:hypothetical protein